LLSTSKIFPDIGTKISGNEFHWIPQCPSHIPLVGDFSSTFMSRPMPSSRDFAKFGVIFAGVQKNLGAPGVTVVIVRVSFRFPIGFAIFLVILL
jgi:phosphoserine aminotransferase